MFYGITGREDEEEEEQGPINSSSQGKYIKICKTSCLVYLRVSYSQVALLTQNAGLFISWSQVLISTGTVLCP